MLFFRHAADLPPEGPPPLVDWMLAVRPVNVEIDIGGVAARVTETFPGWFGFRLPAPRRASGAVTGIPHPPSGGRTPKAQRPGGSGRGLKFPTTTVKGKSPRLRPH